MVAKFTVLYHLTNQDDIINDDIINMEIIYAMAG